MGNFGNAAIKAVELIREGSCNNPEEAWNKSLNEHTDSENSRSKGCPREAFLGLCEEGIVVGIPAGKYTSSKKNKAYAIKAVGMLRKSERKLNQNDLWTEIAPGVAPDGQMDVVLSLWKRGLIKQ